MARLRRRIGLHQQRKAGALDAVGDPGFGAIDEIVVAVATGGHPDGLKIGSCVGFGQCKSAPYFARSQFWEPCRLLVGRPKLFDCHCQHQVRVEDAGDCHPDAGDAHHDLGVSGRGQPQPTVLCRDSCAEKSEPLHLLDDLGRIPVRVIMVFHDRFYVPCEPTVDRVEQLFLFVVINRARARTDAHRYSSDWTGQELCLDYLKKLNPTSDKMLPLRATARFAL